MKRMDPQALPVGQFSFFVPAFPDDIFQEQRLKYLRSRKIFRSASSIFEAGRSFVPSQDMAVSKALEDNGCGRASKRRIQVYGASVQERSATSGAKI